MLEQWPYTDLHNLNLDWILAKVKQNEENIANLFAITPGASDTQTVSVKDYGAKGDGSTDDSDAIQKCLNATNSAYFPVGNYYIAKSISLPNNSNLYFDNCGIVIPNTVTAFINSARNVKICGKCAVKGGASSYFVLFNDNNTCLISGFFTYDGFGNGAVYNGYKGQNIKIEGRHSTNNAPIVVLNCCSDIDVSGIYAVYNTDIGNCAINIVTDETNYAFKNIHIHNNYIDNNKHTISACINISRLDPVSKLVYNPRGKNWIACDNINVHDNTCLNGKNPCDGIDVLYCSNVRITNNIVNSCFEGIAILSDDVCCANNICIQNDSCGIALGDYTLGSNGTNFTSITLTGNLLFANGEGSGQYVIPAGIGMVQPESCYIATLYAVNNVIATSKYGLYSGANSGGSNLVFVGNMITGTTGSIYSPNDGLYTQMVTSNNPGINPRGFLTPPTISTQNVANNYGCNVQVSIINGTTEQLLYVNDIALTVLKPNSVTTFTLPPLAKMRVATSGEGCSMAWFGL